MEIRKNKNITISISIPEDVNDFLNKAVNEFNKKNPKAHLSKSYLISVIIMNAIADHHENLIEQDKNAKA